MDSTRPSTMPPSIAPARLPMPPSTAAVKAFEAGHEAHRVVGDAVVGRVHHPGHRGQPEPMMKVAAMILLVSTPIRLAPVVLGGGAHGAAEASC